MANYRGSKCSITETVQVVSGFYCPAPADAYDSTHAFLYFYGTFRYGELIDMFPAVTPSGGAANRVNAAGTFVKAP